MCRPRRVMGMRKGLIQRWKKMPSCHSTCWGGGLERLAPGARMLTSKVWRPGLAPAMQKARWASTSARMRGPLPASAGGGVSGDGDVHQVDDAAEGQVVAGALLGGAAKEGVFEVHSGAVGCSSQGAAPLGAPAARGWAGRRVNGRCGARAGCAGSARVGGPAPGIINSGVRQLGGRTRGRAGGLAGQGCALWRDADFSTGGPLRQKAVVAGTGSFRSCRRALTPGDGYSDGRRAFAGRRRVYQPSACCQITLAGVKQAAFSSFPLVREPESPAEATLYRYRNT